MHYISKQLITVNPHNLFTKHLNFGRKRERGGISEMSTYQKAPETTYNGSCCNDASWLAAYAIDSILFEVLHLKKDSAFNVKTI